MRGRQDRADEPPGQEERADRRDVPHDSSHARGRCSVDKDIRFVVIAGGPGAFSTGKDLADFLVAATPAKGWGRRSIRFLHALAHPSGNW